MRKTNEKNCILRGVCVKAGSESHCNKLCPLYNSMHGHKGIGGRVAMANIPKDYQKMTISHNPVREVQKQAYFLIDRWAKKFFPLIFEENAERIKPLYLYSKEVGTGKTATAASIANSFLVYTFTEALKRGQQPLERPVYFLDFNQWQREFAAFNNPKIPRDMGEKMARKFYEIRDIAKDVLLLVVDDIGIEDPSNAFHGIAHDLINHRLVNWLPTIFTSNVEMEDLLLRYDKRLFDRIRDHNSQIEFIGTSHRGMRQDFDV
ncbi:DNA replication protein [Thermoactinomyces daqus]|uniref:DNA replication protein n=1 Tax=Thermoactinomyces daqus TaxID=1329516 RepID=A0A7W1XA75_9BACL|nr:DNA replication protein [Thermoactinomyces daqus]MBA4542870.1 DNA replication protein [Thermoactinomyces daqus]